MHLSSVWLFSCYYLFIMFCCFGNGLKQLYTGLQTYLKRSDNYYPVSYRIHRKNTIYVFLLLSSIAIIVLGAITHSYYKQISISIPTLSAKQYINYIYPCWELEGSMLGAAYAGYFILSSIGPIAIYTSVVFAVCTIYSLCDELHKIQRWEQICWINLSLYPITLVT